MPAQKKPTNITKFNNRKRQGNSLKNSLSPKNNSKSEKWAKLSAVTSPISRKKQGNSLNNSSSPKNNFQSGKWATFSSVTSPIRATNRKRQRYARTQRSTRVDDVVPTELFPTNEVESPPSPEGNRLLSIRRIMEGIENNLLCKKCSSSNVFLIMKHSV